MDLFERELRKATEALGLEFQGDTLLEGLLRLTSFAGSACAAFLEGDRKALLAFLVNVSAQARLLGNRITLEREPSNAVYAATARCG
jgi:hypothetical protein